MQHRYGPMMQRQSVSQRRRAIGLQGRGVALGSTADPQVLGWPGGSKHVGCLPSIEGRRKMDHYA